MVDLLLENTKDQETELVLIETGKATAGGKPTSTWARLIRRIFEVDPLRCTNCGKQMRIAVDYIPDVDLYVQDPIYPD